MKKGPVQIAVQILFELGLHPEELNVRSQGLCLQLLPSVPEVVHLFEIFFTDWQLVTRYYVKGFLLLKRYKISGEVKISNFFTLVFKSPSFLATFSGTMFRLVMGIFFIFIYLFQTQIYQNSWVPLR